jgi:soluble lytic murein transglycosylase
MRRPLAVSCTVVALAFIGGDRLGAQGGVTPTNHPPIPGHPSLYWLVPDLPVSRTGGRAAGSASASFARGVTLIKKNDFAAGLPLVRGGDLAATPLAAYSRYYTGVALLGLRRPQEAEGVLDGIGNMPVGYLQEAVPLKLAEAALAAGHTEKAVEILDDLSDEEDLADPEAVLVQLGGALEAAGEREDAFRAYQRVYYEFPLTDEATTAQAGMERLLTPALIPSDRFRLELGRAEHLFTARRWAQARAAFAALSRAAGREHRELIALRLAECDYYLGRHRAAREALVPYLDDASREAEARFFHLSSIRALGDQTTYVRLARQLVAEHPDSSWSEETLNNLASHYITNDDDAEADQVFRELARRFPKSRYADRAAWKIGWFAYKQDRFEEAAKTFEAAAAAFPRADYRPSWLYWAARSRDQMGSRSAANALYRIVAGDYLNSYYGRLASSVLSERREPPVQPIVAVDKAPATPLVPNDAVIRALIGAGLYDDALREVDYARDTWGDSAPLQATIAWIRNRRGLAPGADQRFVDVRGAITIMRRAYPQFMAAGGEQLPPDVLRVIFPLDYWALIKKYSDAHKLDPYLMTALVAQESTFTPDVRSSANAVGLMQLIPGTGRRYASKLGIRYSARILTQPETNIRLGMRYFKDLIDRFGGAHYALASYNAGEHRIARWIEERPDFTQDEFIDDIPFPETQTYVKRILGTADDYRRLYGDGVLSAANASR